MDIYAVYYSRYESIVRRSINKGVRIKKAGHERIKKKRLSCRGRQAFIASDFSSRGRNRGISRFDASRLGPGQHPE